MQKRLGSILFHSVASLCMLGFLVLAFLSFWWSAYGYFDYNATGTVLSVDYCRYYAQTTWNKESIGMISVRFQPLGENTSYETDIITPDICTLNSCCKELIGFPVYFKIEYSTASGNYSVVDLSYNKVQDAPRWISLGVFCIGIAGMILIIVLRGCSCGKESTPGKSIDEIELIGNKSSKLEEVD